MIASPQPFKIEVPDADIDALHRRIRDARFPDEVNDADWGYGVDATYLRALVDYWLEDYDWRIHEQKLNTCDQFMLAVEGLDLHFIHHRSAHKDATPILLTHGWPGSIVEFADVVHPLTNPETYGGRAEDAFHVVAPSVPGFGFSQAAREPGMGPRRVAELFARLMAALGYSRYIAQGGDLGSSVSRHLAVDDPEHCFAIHLNQIVAVPPGGMERLSSGVLDPNDDFFAGVTEDEFRALAEQSAWMRTEMGYYAIQSTKPQTLGYALADAPVGLLAWITEKFRSWTDNRGDIRDAVSWDALLTNVSLYWFTNTICSSMRIYLESGREAALAGEAAAYVTAPTGLAVFPGEPSRQPRAWIEQACNLVHFERYERGGHFPAMEQPQALVEDIRKFHRGVRALR
jgi:microsomal epoxide hydrolase